MGKTVYLHTPLDVEQIRALELDDVVYLSGTVYAMMFDSHFERLMEPIRRGALSAGLGWRRDLPHWDHLSQR